MKTVKLSEITDSIDYGVTASASEEPVGPKFLRITDIQNGSVDWSSVPFCKADEKKLKISRLIPGDIVFARTGATTGKSFLIRNCPEHAVFASYLIRVRPSPQVDPIFLSHFFDHPTYWRQISLKSAGAAQPGVNSSKLKELEVPLPPLDEQKRIAAILDQADELRRLRQRAIDRLNELGQAIFYEMFGDPAINRHRWDLIRLAEISTKFSDGPFGSNLKSEHYVEEGIRVIRLQNIGVDAFNDDDKAFISAGHFESLKKHSCVPGDILIGTLGDPNLRACIQPPHIPIALNKADCVQMRCDPKRALAEYVCALLNCPSTERMAQDKIQGQTRLRISMGRLRELRVPIPPIERQFQFAKIMHEIRISATGQLAAQRIIDSLFSSLQHRAFTGELTSKDVERELAIAG